MSSSLKARVHRCVGGWLSLGPRCLAVTALLASPACKPTTTPADAGGTAASTSAPALRQEAYLWQRAWSAEVREALLGSPAELAGHVVLAAEVALRAGRLVTTRVPLDHATLRATRRPVGLALRIGAYAGPFDAKDAVGTGLVALARELVAAAQKAGVTPAELQLDFDAATLALGGYRRWVEAVRAAVAPVPLTLTALPAWLGAADFEALVRATDGYVLQVHSLPSPRGRMNTLCDVGLARRAIARASALGVPFRVALPTYSYAVARNREGLVAAVAAEGPTPQWPEDTEVVHLGADPVALAALTRELAAAPPAALLGLLWYRLPVATDRRNWPLATLRAVLSGRAPKAAIAAEVRARSDGLAEVVLANVGETAAPHAVSVELRWGGGMPLAHDALYGFVWHVIAPGHARLFREDSPSPLPIGPAQRQVIAWARFARPTPLTATLTTAPSTATPSTTPPPQ